MADARRANRGDRARRSWSNKEEEILVATLKELVAQGWKSDNGFRSGYHNKLEEALRREFPTTDIKANPHIQSKICSWKKNYSSLVTILGRSGVGFNSNNDFKIDCEDDQWAQIVRIDSNARLMRNRSWPFWEDWKIIFGKDRATGSNAEDVMEQVNALYSQENVENTNTIPVEDFGLNDLFTEEGAGESLGTNASAAANSVTAGERATPLPKRSNKKRKGDDGLDRMYTLLHKMHEDANSRLQLQSTRIGYEVDLSQARKDVYDLLGDIPGLSMDDKFDVCEMLAKEPDRLDIFMGLPEMARYAYVMRVLQEKREKRGN